MALKVRSLAWAKATGAPEVRTWNESNNQGMLAINIALGFVRQPAWITYLKAIQDEA
jgi:hypothetical protein